MRSCFFHFLKTFIKDENTSYFSGRYLKHENSSHVGNFTKTWN